MSARVRAHPGGASVTISQRHRLQECIHRLQMIAADESSCEAAIGNALDSLVDSIQTATSQGLLQPSYADLYEHSPDMLCSVDPKTGKITRCNQTLADTMGYSKTDVIGRDVFDMYHPDCRDRVRSVYLQFNETGEVHNEELQVCRRDGSVIDVLLNATAARDPQGKILSSRSSWRETTDLKQAERKLAASEQRLRTILDTEPECVKLMDADGTLLEMNPAGLSIIEVDSGEQIVGRSLFPLLVPQHLDAFKDLMRRVFEGESGTLAFELRGLKGSHRWVETHASPLRNAEGEITAMLSVTRDISDQKRAEAVIREREERLRLAMDATEMGSWDWDLRTGEIIWSEGHERLWGLPPGSFQGTYEESETRVHSEDRAGLAAAFTQARETQTSYTHEFRVVWLDGSVHWIAGQGRFDYDESGQPIRVTGVVRNITAQRTAQNALSESHARMQRVLDSMFVFVGLLTPDGKIIEVNRAPLEAAGLERASVIGKSVLETPWFSHSDGVRRELQGTLQRVAAGEPVRRDFTIRLAGDQIITADITFSPLRDESGRVVELVGSAVDITDRVQAQRELCQLNIELEQRIAERTKELQLANDDLDAYARSVAHDLRAPLRAIFSFAKALREDYADGLDEYGREYTDFIESAAQQMDDLVCDVLEYSKIGRTEASLGPVDLDEVVARSLEQQGIGIHQQQAVVDVARPLGTVVGYEDMLVQVITNLVSNGIKFVEPGVRPHVRIRSEASEDSVRVWVEDNGIGIAPEHHVTIFRVFERLHGVEAFPGTGIGLAIVRRAVETMGGRFGVESELGQGSRFWFELRKYECVI